MEKPLISVIVPVYNVEKYLDACVSSICNQTYSNLEIILINDGSRDSSGLLCNEWTEKDERIIVIHKENGGLSDARNAGLKAAKGNYITFVDSDDVISESMLEQLYEKMTLNQADISICDPVHCYSGKPVIYRKETKVVVYTAEDAMAEMMYQTSFLFSAWGKLFKRELFAAIEFPIGLLFEDVAIMYQVFSKTKSIVYFNAKLYGYLHRENSITTNHFSKRDCDILDICKGQVEFSKKYSKDVYKAAKAYQVVGALRVYLNAPNDKSYDKVKEKCEDIIQKGFQEVLKNSHCRSKLKLSLLLYAVNKSLMKKVYVRIDRWK
ncbi:glycosyltransferase family 2 protein [Anaerocolumna sp. AGMB13020]|uniref:glycosyltransferase family 2 protein n=1 Tax=Anaerocolumna sp. AGMB13020 TaxID=3081750 RepID=UPI0029534C08|nr:glycosyltransferase family 2 protein [Anaerocolumna sp. AGMB13020]WOO38857.1 glycosyltransferase family 2 protein [Anaerocolumna sp. AGMB13020]